MATEPPVPSAAIDVTGRLTFHGGRPVGFKLAICAYAAAPFQVRL
jgi:hypothetical protein